MYPPQMGGYPQQPVAGGYPQQPGAYGYPQAAAAPAAAAPAAAPAADALPEGWVETKDPSSGKVYYYHSQTKQTQWDRPGAAAQPAATTAAEGGAAQPAASSGAAADVAKPDAASTPAAGTAAGTAAPAPGGADGGPLPEGWAAATDQGSGKVYFYHAASKQTQWTRPAA